MKKYRVKLGNERIIGPLLRDQIAELFAKGHINGKEKFQHFPGGDWLHLEAFTELADIFFDVMARKVSAADFEDNETRILSKIKKVRLEKEAKDSELAPPDTTSSIKTSIKKEKAGEITRDISEVGDSSLSQFKEFKFNIPDEFESIKNDSIIGGNEEQVRQTSGKMEGPGQKDESGNGKEKTQIKAGESEANGVDGSGHEDSLSTTRMVKRARKSPNRNDNEVEKTVVRPLSPEELAEVEKLKLERERQKKSLEKVNPKSAEDLGKEDNAENGEQADGNSTTKIDFSEGTQMVSLDSIPSKTVLLKIEEDLLNAEKSKSLPPSVDVNSRPKKGNETDGKIPEEQIFENKKKSSSAKKMTPIVALAFIVVIYFTLFDESDKPKGINPISPNILFPVAQKTVDIKGAIAALNQGLALSKKYTYPDKIKAALAFKKSLELNFENSAVIGHLILAYSELLPNVIKVKLQENGNVSPLRDNLAKEKAGNVIFKLIQIGHSKALNDINMVMGTALFYANFGKYATAINTLKKYLYLKGKPSQKFLSIYLNVSILAKDDENSKRIFDMLAKIKKKEFDSYISIANYLFYIKDYKSATKILEECNKVYTNSVRVLLDYGKVLAYQEDLKKLEQVLKLVNELQAEQSGVYFAQFLEFKGLLLAYKGKNKEAAKVMQLALSIQESIELRSRLASLDEGGGNEVSSLIRESKVFDLMRKAEEAVGNNQWDKAFSYAIEASDMSGTNVAAKLQLAEIQTKRGFFGEAIKTLVDLVGLHPLATEVQFALINTCIEAYKFADAKKYLENLAGTDLADSGEYASALAKLFYKQDNVSNAIHWLRKSINRNPLNDKDYYSLAKIFLRFKKFDKSKFMLTKAISLDPANIEYKIGYARILYELESPEIAIGYLEKMLLDNKVVKEIEDKDIPKVIGEMAIYYHKIGQLQQFENLKKELESKYAAEKGFYEFLVNTAKMEDNVEKVVKYSRQLMLLDPGNLEAKSSIGEYLLEHGKIEEASAIFEEIKSRLESYPKIHFYLSKIYLLQNNLEKATELAEMEIKSNPDKEYGHLLFGEILLKQDKITEAMNAFKKAQSINQNSVEALMGLANINLGQNNFEMAQDLYLKASAQSPNNPVINRQLGYVYKALGQGSLAVEAFKVYLKQAPDAKDRDVINNLIQQLQ